jgi:beta-phosphoglucomutase
MIKAVIFDLEGTVINRTENDYLAWEKLFNEYDIDFELEDYQKVLGVKESDVIHWYLNVDAVEVSRLLGKKETYVKEFISQKGINLIPGVESLLEEIKNLGVKTSLATGFGKEKLEYIFEKADIKNYFDSVISTEDVKSGRPDSELYLNAAKRLNILPSACVVLDDEEIGVKAAKEVGMKCIAFAASHTSNKLVNADLVIKSYADFNFKSFYSSCM